MAGALEHRRGGHEPHSNDYAGPPAPGKSSCSPPFHHRRRQQRTQPSRSAPRQAHQEGQLRRSATSTTTGLRLVLHCGVTPAHSPKGTDQSSVTKFYVVQPVYAVAGHIGWRSVLAAVVTFGCAAVLMDPAVGAFSCIDSGIRHAMAVPALLCAGIIGLASTMPRNDDDLGPAVP